MTSPEYQAPTWVNEDDPDFIEGVSPDLGAGYLNQLSGAVEDHGQRLGAITPVVTYLNANAISQDAGDNRWILQDNANGFAPAEATATALAGKQPLDADLTALAGLDSATSGTVASDGSGWVKKTYAQLKTALGLVKGDVGLGSVDNTSDANKPISTATQTALNAKATTSSLATIATSGKLADTTDLTTTGAAVGSVVAATQVDGSDNPTAHGYRSAADLVAPPADVPVRYVSASGSDTTGDGRTPIGAYRTIQAALDDAIAAGSGHAHVIVAPGTYAPFTCPGGPVVVEGMGGIGQDGATGGGATIIDVPSGSWGVEVAVGAAAETFQSVELRNLYCRGQSGALGGFRLGRTSNFVLDRCGAADFTTGTGFRVEGSDSSQYGTLLNCHAFDCQIGIDNVDHNGLRIIGGTIEYLAGDGAAIIAGTFGIRSAFQSDTLRVIGTVVQFAETGISVAGEGCIVSSARLEAFSTGVQLLGAGGQVIGGSFNNFIVGSGGTAIHIDPDTATSCAILSPYIAAVATRVANLTASNTNLVELEGEITTKLVRFGPGAYMQQGSNSGALAVNNQFEVPTSMVVGRDTYESPLYFGGGQDTQIFRGGSDLLSLGAGDSLKVDGTWNGGTLRLGTNYLWVDAAGLLRIKSSAPTSDTDGSIVGTQA